MRAKNLRIRKNGARVGILFIILLFSFLPGWGQDLLQVPNVQVETNRGWIRFDSTIQILTIQYILVAYSEYEKECYADSTQKSGWKFKETENYGNGIVSGYEEYTDWWEHRPPTFEEFIKFLRKYGEGKKSE